jgi:hypothetical protein
MMNRFTVTFYEACFHRVTVAAEDAASAEGVARDILSWNPEAARTKTRGLVRWHVEPAEAVDEIAR